MNRSDFNIKDDMEKDNDLILKKTKEEINNYQEQFKEDVFSTVCNDIEDWLFERYENIRREYFNSIVAFLTGEKFTYIKDKETLQKWLQGIGYTQQSLREKIYQENKEIINQQITSDALYEKIDHMFYAYFGNWEFSDISINYPQTRIIESFLKKIIEKDGFNDEIKKMLNDEIKEKIDELKFYKNQIKELNDELKKIGKVECNEG